MTLVIRLTTMGRAQGTKIKTQRLPGGTCRVPAQGSVLHRQSQPHSPRPCLRRPEKACAREARRPSGELRGHGKSTGFVIRPEFDPGSTPLVLNLPEHLLVSHWTPRSTVSPEARGQRGAAPPGLARRQLGTEARRQAQPSRSTAPTAGPPPPVREPRRSLCSRGKAQVDQRATPARPVREHVGGVLGGSLGGEPRAG